jgi:nitroreductase
MGMMMLQATELGYETNGMLGFEPETMKEYLVAKG